MPGTYSAYLQLAGLILLIGAGLGALLVVASLLILSGQASRQEERRGLGEGD